MSISIACDMIGNIAAIDERQSQSGIEILNFNICETRKPNLRI